ncbi:unnamed protein product [Protopolystoma xenopodis]|uniref:Uncharacterized protein n=1 Tax=Protopolystoma xenopodis TaxID=117903 RepID=A0A448XB25_9PLAT|nr:unnamed protein product [Protopolystoma xenopodis]
MCLINGDSGARSILTLCLVDDMHVYSKISSSHSHSLETEVNSPTIAYFSYQLAQDENTGRQILPNVSQTIPISVDILVQLTFAPSRRVHRDTLCLAHPPGEQDRLGAAHMNEKKEHEFAKIAGQLN